MFKCNTKYIFEYTICQKHLASRTTHIHFHMHSFSVLKIPSVLLLPGGDDSAMWSGRIEI